MSCCRDSDNFGWYGWLEPGPGQPANAPVNLSAKTELVAWVVSSWRKDSSPSGHGWALPQAAAPGTHDLVPVPVQVLPGFAELAPQLHERSGEACPAGLAHAHGVSPQQEEPRTVPAPNTFVHMDSFQSPKELAQDLLGLDKDHVGHLSYFHWREVLQP